MKDSWFIRFLYRTVPGRMILSILVNPTVSCMAAVFLSSRLSAVLVPVFIRMNHINMKYYVVPQGGYGSFNDFFTRKLKHEYIPSRYSVFVSPCDGLLSVHTVDKDSVFHIKHSSYRLSDLLNDTELATDFRHGTVFIFRLTPRHYHRYVYCTSGKVSGHRRLDGILHCVRPVAVGSTDVYIRNTREYTVMDNTDLGTIIQMEVGALLVGKISNAKDYAYGSYIRAGLEKGCFEYGGSTIIILTERIFDLNDELKYRAKIGGEIPVMLGESLI